MGNPRPPFLEVRHSPFLEVRDSPVHGLGAFAAKRIRKGTRIVEYLGERISVEEGSRRYTDEDDSPHVLLFGVDETTVIDAAVEGNEAQFLNHCCEPNCETEVIGGRVFMIALRTIEQGEELTYDYHLDYDGEQTDEVKRKFACRCGASSCRGTMLEPPPPKPRAVRRGRLIK
jgi:uncharacterized protein